MVDYLVFTRLETNRITTWSSHLLARPAQGFTSIHTDGFTTTQGHLEYPALQVDQLLLSNTALLFERDTWQKPTRHTDTDPSNRGILHHPPYHTESWPSATGIKIMEIYL